MQDTNGAFYGTTFLGGSNWDGTLFKLSVGLSGATAPTFNPHISQTERTELKTSTRISFPQPVVGRRS